MRKVTWTQSGLGEQGVNRELMTDRYFFWGKLCISKHFRGVSAWTIEGHLKGSNKTYCNFRRQKSLTHYWNCTRFTLRLGSWIISCGPDATDIKEYYKDVVVLTIKNKGKLTYSRMSDLEPWDGVSKVLGYIEDAKKMRQKNAEHLNRSYPDQTWRN